MASRRRHRDELGILASILKAAITPEIVTRIYSMSNTCYTVFRPRLDRLIRAGMIEATPIEGRGRTRYLYTTTPKGTRWLDLLRELYRMLAEAP